MKIMTKFLAGTLVFYSGINASGYIFTKACANNGHSSQCIREAMDESIGTLPRVAMSPGIEAALSGNIYANCLETHGARETETVPTPGEYQNDNISRT